MTHCWAGFESAGCGLNEHSISARWAAVSSLREWLEDSISLSMALPSTPTRMRSAVVPCSPLFRESRGYSGAEQLLASCTHLPSAAIAPALAKAQSEAATALRKLNGVAMRVMVKLLLWGR